MDNRFKRDFYGFLFRQAWGEQVGLSKPQYTFLMLTTDPIQQYYPDEGSTS